MGCLEGSGNIELRSPRSCSQTKWLSKFHQCHTFWSESDALNFLPQSTGEGLGWVYSRIGEKVFNSFQDLSHTSPAEKLVTLHLRQWSLDFIPW